MSWPHQPQPRLRGERRRHGTATTHGVPARCRANRPRRPAHAPSQGTSRAGPLAPRRRRRQRARGPGRGASRPAGRVPRRGPAPRRPGMTGRPGAGADGCRRLESGRGVPPLGQRDRPEPAAVRRPPVEEVRAPHPQSAPTGDDTTQRQVGDGLGHALLGQRGVDPRRDVPAVGRTTPASSTRTAAGRTPLAGRVQTHREHHRVRRAPGGQLVVVHGEHPRRGPRRRGRRTAYLGTAQRLGQMRGKAHRSQPRRWGGSCGPPDAWEKHLRAQIFPREGWAQGCFSHASARGLGPGRFAHASARGRTREPGVSGRDGNA